MLTVFTGLYLYMGKPTVLNCDFCNKEPLLTVLAISLTSGSCLLLAGAVADVVGCRPIYLTGCFLTGCFVLGCGLARTGIELIMFRAMQGIALALCLPTSVGILTNTMPSGKRRNVAFACLGLGQVLGFSIGLVLGGVFVDTVGWRVGWYSCASLVLVLLLVGIVSIPSDRLSRPPTMKRLTAEIDWIGGLLATACLAMLSYVLMYVSKAFL
jgi:MFS family permease